MNTDLLGGSSVLHPEDLDIFLGLMNDEEAESRTQKYLRLSHTLKRALIDKASIVESSTHSTGEEIASSFPTYNEGVTTLDPFYMGASAASLTIAGLIKYRGVSQQQELEIALAIWSEFQHNMEFKDHAENDEDRRKKFLIALETLERRFQQNRTIFSGLSKHHDLRHFDALKFKTLSEELGIWSSPQDAFNNKVSVPRRLTKDFLRASRKLTPHKAFIGAVGYGLHMVEDMVTKWTYAETWRGIGRGFTSSPRYIGEFKILSSRFRDSKRPSTSHEALQAHRRIEDHDIVSQLVEEGDIPREKIENLVRRRQAIIRDITMGKVFATGFLGETVFISVHVLKGAIKATTAALTNDQGNIDLPFQILSPTVHNAIVDYLTKQSESGDTQTALIVNAYSFFMVLGAYAFLGSGSASLYERIQRNKAVMSNVIGEIETAYMAKYGEPDTPAPA